MNVIILLVTFFSMEAITWFVHKYVMHGFMWKVHRDHHDFSSKGRLEKNDYFFIIFALPAIALVYKGGVNGFDYLFYIGTGVTLYGLAYFFVHDLFIHQRLHLLDKTQNPYLLAIRRAHKQHHRHMTKENGECFGFLFVPIRYFLLYFKKKVHDTNA